jgi:hypothetical protein
MKLKTLQSDLRKFGYQLAVREIYGENTPAYFTLKAAHKLSLKKLYRLEKRV